MVQDHKDGLAAKDAACQLQITKRKEELDKNFKTLEVYIRRQVREEKEKAESEKRAAEEKATKSAAEEEAKLLVRRSALIEKAKMPKDVINYLLPHQNNKTFNSIDQEQISSKEKCISGCTERWKLQGNLFTS
jgi:3-oxoacyl-[acyl-carrier-protein] synthase III